MKTQLRLILFASVLGVSLAGARAQGTAFTYQGRLNDGASPANGNYDLRFTIYDSTNNPGIVIAGPLTNSSSSVSNGLFTATLDFGAGVFDGTPRFLEIAVRTNGGVAFAALAPRQALAPTPYAIFANSASNLLGVVSSGQLSGPYSGPVQFNNGADSFNGTFIGQFFGSTFTGGNFSGNFLGSGSGLFDVWHTGGNSGTTAGVNYIGTSDFQPLELKGGGQRILRLEPDTRGSAAGNLVGGFTNNAIEQSGSGGDFIGGGGFPGGANIIHSNSSGVFIGAGSANQVGPNVNDVVIVGGIANSVGQNSVRTFIGSGYQNVNAHDSYDAVIVGGELNSIGTNNYESVIVGGYFNLIGNNNFESAIVGGDNNSILVPYSSAFIGGGFQNTISSNGYGGIIVGGGDNTNNGNVSFIGAGNQNLVNSDESVIVGGFNNTVSSNSVGTTITGGTGNYAGGQYSFIGGGAVNSANGFLSTSVGGQGNAAIANNSTMVGGLFNTNFGVLAFMGGGDNNFASGFASVISGGESNNAWGQFSMAAGYHASAFHDGTFVWSDFEPANFSFNSTSSNQFLIRALNGVGINTNNPQAALHVNGTIIANNFIGGGATLSGLNFSQLTGTLLSSEFSGTYSSALTFNNAGNSFTGNGSGLTSLNANNISSGTVADARLTANVALLNRDPQTFTGQNSFNGSSVNIAGSLVMTDPTKSISFPSTSGANAPMITMFSSGIGNANRMVIAHSSAFSSYGLQYEDANDRFYFIGGGVNALTIDLGTRNVGVGVTNPATRFQVVNATCDGNNWVNSSDRNLKENFTPVEPLSVLEKVAELPILKWNYKTDPAQTHLGPVAQDFRAAFELGPDDKHIATVDEGGVALAAIQGLNQKLEEQRGELTKKETEISELKQRLERLEQLMDRRGVDVK
jgi:Chaperone of endosialidase